MDLSLPNLENTATELGMASEILAPLDKDQAHPEPSQLCFNCQNIIDYWPDDSDPQRTRRFLHYGSESALIASADHGCSLCRQFVLGYNCKTWSNWHWDEGEEPGPGEGRVELDSGRTLLSKHYRDCYWWIHLFIPASSHNARSGSHAPRTEEEYLQYEVAAAPVAASDTAQFQYNSLNTDAALPLVKKWLESRRKSHPLCSGATNTEKVPTRLIDIARNEPRLCLGVGLKGPIEYSTLSHCWGSPDPSNVTLGENNIGSFLHRIPRNALPKTFRDFIQINRFFGIQYVWIDSLCIVQDDEEDWKAESARMTNVYGEAVLNVAAAGAVDGSVGCFFERSKTWRCQANISVEHQGKTLEFFPFHFQKLLTETPLASRGWALQERILPRRTVFFGQTQVFWECNELQACEIFPHHYPPEIRPEKLWPITTKGWKNIVASYSRCSITFSRDKLVALSGLARLMQQESGIEYVAGLWRKNLESQLGWQRTHSPGRRERPAVYRAPSWSWASIDGSLMIPKRSGLSERASHHIFNVTVRRVLIQPLFPDNPFGEILSATLNLRCDYLCRANLHEIEDSDRGYTLIDLERKTFRLSVLFDCSEVFENRRLQVHLLSLYTYKTRFLCNGLILQPTGNSPGQYRRIGIFDGLQERVSGEDRLSEADFFPPHDDDYSEIYVDEQGRTQRAIDII